MPERLSRCEHIPPAATPPVKPPLPCPPPVHALLFVLLPATLLLDLAGPAESFRLANQHLVRRGRPAAYGLHFVGPEAATPSSVGLVFSGLAPLPDALPASARVVLMGQTGQRFADGSAMGGAAWVATRDWLGRQLAPRLRDPGPPCLLTVCSGALLAADAGLLAHRRCTTHHELLADLQRLAPTADVVGNRVFVIDGPVASSAGVTAGVDLALQVIADDCGDDIAAAVAQDMVVYLRRGPQDPQLSPLLQHRNHLHPAVHRVQDAVGADTQSPWPLPALARVAHVTERHLRRLFAEHAGVSPLHYVERIRVEHARRALQRGASVAHAAEVAGFASSLQLRRAWARQVGGTPVGARQVAD